MKQYVKDHGIFDAVSHMAEPSQKESQAKRINSLDHIEAHDTEQRCLQQVGGPEWKGSPGKTVGKPPESKLLTDGHQKDRVDKKHNVHGLKSGKFHSALI